MTIFTKIINREIPADIVYEDDLCLAFKDINPKAPVHILLIPKRKIPTMDDLVQEDKEIMGHLILKASDIARQQGLAQDGYRIVINNRENAGQEVFHIHIHILGGRKMSWPPG
ncbi:MAG: histidine triad nucleotide-binding protein [Spirochaetes bacterium]|nr:histidine triad nucleotide-binding protein [Spirochaetota bacterium]